MQKCKNMMMGFHLCVEQDLNLVADNVSNPTPYERAQILHFFPLLCLQMTSNNVWSNINVQPELGTPGCRK